MSFHHAAGRQGHAVKNINRLHKTAPDRFAHMLDPDTLFERHTQGNAGRNRRSRLLCQSCRADHQQDEATPIEFVGKNAHSYPSKGV